MKQEIHKLPNQSDQVEVLSSIALRQANAGEKSVAQSTLREASILANSFETKSIDKPVALSSIAATQSRMGLADEARITFDRVNKLIAKIPNRMDRLSAYIKISQAYARADNRGGAIRMLQEALAAAGNIDQPQKRNFFLTEIAINQATLGDMDAAIDSVGQISSPINRDAAFLKLTSELLYSGHIYRAMAASEQINSSALKARVFALMARFQYGTNTAALAEENFQRAVQQSGQIKNLAERASIVSEIARMRMRTGNQESAQNLFTTALTLTDTLGDTTTRATTISLIAKNQARALLTAQAKESFNRIEDPSVADNLRQDIGKISKAIDAIQQAM